MLVQLFIALGPHGDDKHSFISKQNKYNVFYLKYSKNQTYIISIKNSKNQHECRNCIQARQVQLVYFIKTRIKNIVFTINCTTPMCEKLIITCLRKLVQLGYCPFISNLSVLSGTIKYKEP